MGWYGKLNEFSNILGKFFGMSFLSHFFIEIVTKTVFLLKVLFCSHGKTLLGERPDKFLSNGLWETVPTLPESCPCPLRVLIPSAIDSA